MLLLLFMLLLCSKAGKLDNLSQISFVVAQWHFDGKFNNAAAVDSAAAVSLSAVAAVYVAALFKMSLSHNKTNLREVV
jgi:prenyltransferase beta subunit